MRFRSFSPEERNPSITSVIVSKVVIFAPFFRGQTGVAKSGYSAFQLADWVCVRAERLRIVQGRIALKKLNFKIKITMKIISKMLKRLKTCISTIFKSIILNT